MAILDKLVSLLRMRAMRKVVHAHSTWLDSAALPQIACFPRDWIGREIVTAGLYEREVLEGLADNLFSLSSHRHDAVALDIGANIGNHSVFLARHFKEVVAFEPNPVALHLLRANLLANGIRNVKVIEAGLGDADAMLPFTLQEGNLGGARIIEDTGAEADMKLPIQIGDDVLAIEVPAPGVITFVKIDVEGHELKALQGLSGTLQAQHPVVAFESHCTGGPAGGDAVVAFLKGCGYRHFYSIESRTLFPEFLRIGLVKLIEKLIIGHAKILAPLPLLQDRFYTLVLASAEPLRVPYSRNPFSGTRPHQRIARA